MKRVSLGMSLFLGLIISISLCMPSASFALRDPTQPATVDSGDADETGFVVKMIKLSREEAVANVNGKIVRVGDEVNGAKVISIERDTVLFRTVDNNVFSVSVNHYYGFKKNMDESYESKK